MFGWTGVLGLRMGPRPSPRHVLGWPIVGSDASRLTLEADSRVVDTQNVVLVDDGAVRWVTFVRYRNLLGRILWAVAAPIHQLLIPNGLRRANRSAARRGGDADGAHRS